MCHSRHSREDEKVDNEKPQHTVEPGLVCVCVCLTLIMRTLLNVLITWPIVLM